MDPLGTRLIAPDRSATTPETPETHETADVPAPPQSPKSLLVEGGTEEVVCPKSSVRGAIWPEMQKPDEPNTPQTKTKIDLTAEKLVYPIPLPDNLPLIPGLPRTQTETQTRT